MWRLTRRSTRNNDLVMIRPSVAPQNVSWALDKKNVRGTRSDSGWLGQSALDVRFPRLDFRTSLRLCPSHPCIFALDLSCVRRSWHRRSRSRGVTYEEMQNRPIALTSPSVARRERTLSARSPHQQRRTQSRTSCSSSPTTSGTPTSAATAAGSTRRRTSTAWPRRGCDSATATRAVRTASRPAAAA